MIVLLAALVFAGEPEAGATADGATCKMPRSAGVLEGQVPEVLPKPPIDARPPAHVRTATFALG